MTEPVNRIALAHKRAQAKLAAGTVPPPRRRAKKWPTAAQAEPVTQFECVGFHPKPGACKFHVRRTVDGIVWCNAPRFDGGSYCGHHHTRCYRKPETPAK